MYCHLACLLHSFCVGWGIWSVNILWCKSWTAFLITSHRSCRENQSVSLLSVNEFESVCCSAVAVAPLLPQVVSIVRPGNTMLWATQQPGLSTVIYKACLSESGTEVGALLFPTVELCDFSGRWQCMSGEIWCTPDSCSVLLTETEAR